MLRITVDPDDESLNLRKIVHRDENGFVIGIDLPDRMVLMANHQVDLFSIPTTLALANFLAFLEVYCDWSYIWCACHALFISVQTLTWPIFA